MDIFNKNNYHFIGVGGIGISAIARMLLLQNKSVSGSDNSRSEITDDLAKLGAKISIGQKAENIQDNTEVVIYTVAITDDNPELMEARKRNLVCLSYPEALGVLSKQMFTIAISGTHGKTTTTAMIAHIMKKVGLDPTVVVGSKMLSDSDENGSNFIAGESKYLVVEACEYKRSFLNLYPTILVITNIEADHLDYYKDLADIQNAFTEIAKRVPKNGFIVANLKEANTNTCVDAFSAIVLDYQSVNTSIELLVPGKHNILNAQTAIKVAEALGIDKNSAEEALKDFRGTWRRLEYKGERDNKIFYDDYAHHPTEIAASLSALKEKYPEKKLVCIFEPHQQSRTRLMLKEFADSLQIADQVFIAPIFITREKDDGETTNQTLATAVNEMTQASAIKDIAELKGLLKKEDTNPSCIVFMGAGNIYKWTAEILKD